MKKFDDFLCVGFWVFLSLLLASVVWMGISWFWIDEEELVFIFLFMSLWFSAGIIVTLIGSLIINIMYEKKHKKTKVEALAQFEKFLKEYIEKENKDE